MKRILHKNNSNANNTSHGNLNRDLPAGGEIVREEIRETTFVDSAAPVAPVVITQPAFIEERSLPPIIKETILPSQVEEIQPIVHREINRTEVHEIIQPVMEREVLPTHVVERQAEAEYKELRQPGSDFVLNTSITAETSGRIVENTSVETVMKPAVVEEKITKRIIEQVQPVIYREIIEPQTIVEERPIFERIIEAPYIVREHRPPIEGHYMREQSMGYSIHDTMTVREPMMARDQPAFAQQGLQYRENMYVREPSPAFREPLHIREQTSPAFREQMTYREQVSPVYREQMNFREQSTLSSERVVSRSGEIPPGYERVLVPVSIPAPPPLPAQSTQKRRLFGRKKATNGDTTLAKELSRVRPVVIQDFGVVHRRNRNTTGNAAR